MSKSVLAIIIKDLKYILRSKQLIALMLLVPLVLTVIMPSIFVIAISNLQVNMDDFKAIIEKVVGKENVELAYQKQLIISYFLNNILPVFFMLIPTMMSTIISSNSFIGEREKHTLETLYYSPIKVRDIFIAKNVVSICLSMILNFAVFIVMTVIINIVLLAVGMPAFIPGLKWLIVILCTSLAITIISTGIVVSKSNKSDSVEEAQQSAVFIILPIIGLVVGQFTGFIMISKLILAIASLIFLIISVMVLKLLSNKNDYYA
ncbi:ABC transporter permease subunit [Pseudobutyrivibrio xylanivorans]|uniref:ABC-2 family transporter protein n=1 Tax=Pseudobutyrivibrio xylanivorans TaxID=185007 RepID=A0A1G5RYH9_PSEXY|nr:ABC transporter permease subunit [Pseudobutyrivibrio xylanivorans]SCZ78898.1 ABC-2 family transporter protein [Pseudobutyrivibrio xylanivorans]